MMAMIPPGICTPGCACCDINSISYASRPITPGQRVWGCQHLAWLIGHGQRKYMPNLAWKRCGAGRGESSNDLSRAHEINVRLSVLRGRQSLRHYEQPHSITAQYFRSIDVQQHSGSYDEQSTILRCICSIHQASTPFG